MYSMSTVTVNLPDDVKTELDDFLERNPQFESEEDVLIAMLRSILEFEKGGTNIEFATDAVERDEEEQAVDALRKTVESNQRGIEAMLRVFGIPASLSDEAEEKVRRSEEEFASGDYVSLEEA